MNWRWLILFEIRIPSTHFFTSWFVFLLDSLVVPEQDNWCIILVQRSNIGLQHGLPNKIVPLIAWAFQGKTEIFSIYLLLQNTVAKDILGKYQVMPWDTPHKMMDWKGWKCFGTISKHIWNSPQFETPHNAPTTYAFCVAFMLMDGFPVMLQVLEGSGLIDLLIMDQYCSFQYASASSSAMQYMQCTVCSDTQQ